MIFTRIAMICSCCLPLYAGPREAEVFQLDRNIIFRDDFRSGTTGRWKLSEDDRYNLPKADPGRISVVDAPGLPDRKAVRFDVPRAANSFRAEISLPHEQGFLERWYAGRILIPKDWVIERHSKGNDIVMQWHGIPGNWKATFPNLEISIGEESWHVRRSFGTARDKPTRTAEIVSTLQAGEWVSWVIHAKWSPREDGVIRIWKDGKLVYQKSGPNVYGDIGVDYTPYLKTGIYHPEWNLNTDRKRTAFEADRPDSTRKTIYGTAYRVGGAHASYEEMTAN